MRLDNFRLQDLVATIDVLQELAEHAPDNHAIAETLLHVKFLLDRKRKDLED